MQLVHEEKKLPVSLENVPKKKSFFKFTQKKNCTQTKKHDV